MHLTQPATPPVPARTDGTAPSPEAWSPEAPQHGAVKSVALHLVPGLLCLGFYVLAAPVVMGWGFPALFASVLTIPLIIVPWMLGWMGYEARRETGRFEPMAVVAYRERLRPRTLLGLSVALVLWGAVLFAAAEGTGATEWIRSHLQGLPAWFLHPAEFDVIVAMATPQLVVFLAAMVLFVGVVAPVVEELYFRGWLMARIGRAGVWAPLLGVALFTLYHFESPWENPVRFLVVLPMAYAVWLRRSVRIGVVVHVALNTLSAVALAVAVMAAR